MQLLLMTRRKHNYDHKALRYRLYLGSFAFGILCPYKYNEYRCSFKCLICDVSIPLPIGMRNAIKSAFGQSLDFATAQTQNVKTVQAKTAHQAFIKPRNVPKRRR